MINNRVFSSRPHQSKPRFLLPLAEAQRREIKCFKLLFRRWNQVQHQ